MMGSAMAMLMGAGPSKANAAVGGDTASADVAADFLAALVAAVPAETTALQGEICAAPQPGSEDGSGESAAVDVSSLIAAMLQTLAAPASAAAPAQESAAVEVNDPAGMAPAKNTRQQAATVLASLLEASAAAKSPQPQPESVRVDQAVGQFSAALTESAGDAAAAPQPAPRADLRQLLQMMTPAERRPAPSSAAAITHPDSDGPASVELPMHAAEAAVAAVARNTAAQEFPSEPIPTAGSVASDLAPTTAATTAASQAAQNLNAPVHTPVPTGGADSTLRAQVGTPRWADELGSRVMLMSLHGQHEGSLTLTPEHLGPVEVRVSVNQNTTDVWFGAPHADTRAALTEALPRLRELFAGAGLTLGSADVSQQAPRQRGQGGATGRSSAAGEAPAVDGLDSVNRPAARRVALGLVDTYV